jgi:hypothetical protein
MRSLFVMGLISVGLLAGCVTNEGGYKEASAVEDRILELSPQELTSMLGAPTEEVQLDAETRVWTYRAKEYDVTGGACLVNVTVRNNEIISSTVLSRDTSWISFPLGACKNIIGKLK